MLYFLTNFQILS